MDAPTPPSLQFKYSNDFKPFYFSDRENMIRIAMEYLKSSKLAGDYLEFGVHTGSTFQAAYFLAQREGLDEMRFYAFDSFQGMPKSEGIDQLDSLYQFVEGQYACTEDEFLRSITGNGLDRQKVHTLPGWFQDTLTEKNRQKLPIEKAAVIWVDCDLYASTVPVLEFLTPLLQSGTILCFDDWFSFLGNPDRGEQKAFREWCDRHPEFRCIDYHVFGKWGKSFIVNYI